jgi:uncharacterized protein involved in exopolysaccharide biosynthesis
MPETSLSTPRAAALQTARVMWGRRKWVAILSFCAPFALLASLIAGMPDLYRASATVLVKQDLESDFIARAPDSGGLEPRLQLISEQLMSRPRLEALVERFGLYRTLRARAAPEAVIARMRKDLRLERRQAGQQWGRSVIVAFTLSYQAWNPQTAADVVNTLASEYVAENERLRESRVAGSRAAGSVDEMARLKRELAELRTSYSERYPDVIRLRAQIAALQRERAAAGRESAPPPAAPEPAGDESGAQFRVLDPAPAPQEPSAPPRLRLVLMALALSIGIAGAVVLLVDQFDTSFHRLDDLWAFTDVPVLASVPRIVTRGDAWRRALRIGVAGVVAVSAIGALAHAGFQLGRSGEQLVWIVSQRGA